MPSARRSRLPSIPTPLMLALAMLIAIPAAAFAADEPKKDDDLAKRAYDLLLAGDEKKPEPEKPADDAEKPKPAPAPTPAPEPKPETPGAPWPGGSGGAAKPKPFVPPAGALPGANGALTGTGTPTPAPAPAPKPATPAPAPAPAPRPVPPPPASGEYAIKEGDTFSSIAIALYGDEKKWAAIAQANPLVDPTKLKVGQKIRLPDLAKAEQERAEQFEHIAKELAAPAAAEQTVTVQPGDTLSHIAHRVYGKARHWRLIFEANKDQLETPDSVKVGQKLKIPPKPADVPPAPAPAPTPAKNAN